MTKMSLDDGVTWIDMLSNVRFIFKEAYEDDDELLDLHVKVTHEVIFLDVIGQVSGQCVSTAALQTESLVEMTS